MYVKNDPIFFKYFLCPVYNACKKSDKKTRTFFYSRTLFAK